MTPKNRKARSKTHSIDTSFLKGKTTLITGATGSFGKRCIRRLLETDVHKIIVFSRDELKQSEMSHEIQDPRIRFFIGDVRDKQRLSRAFYNVDFVIHAAALKQVPTLEYNPYEAVLTNIVGAQNIIDAAIDQNVRKVVALSTDKAVNPINLYGATKLCAEKLFISGNAYAGGHKTRFSVVRYGNVIGSRGSIVPMFMSRRRLGELPITDIRMTRFWITLDQGVDLVLRTLGSMHGGEIFVPKIPSMRVVDLAETVAPECKHKIIGIRPGEKLHEALLADEEIARTLDTGETYIVKPNFCWTWGNGNWLAGKPVPADFCYTSNANKDWLGPEDLRKLVEHFASEPAKQTA